MSRDNLLKTRWEQVVKILSDRFADGETFDRRARIGSRQTRILQGTKTRPDAYRCVYPSCTERILPARRIR